MWIVFNNNYVRNQGHYPSLFSEIKESKVKVERLNDFFFKLVDKSP